MTAVAICARNFIGIVIIAMPAESCVVRVAIDTEAVLHTDWRRGIRTEQHIGGGSFLAALDTTGVIARRAVAGLALQLTVSEWSVRVSRVAVRALK